MEASPPPVSERTFRTSDAALALAVVAILTLAYGAARSRTGEPPDGAIFRLLDPVWPAPAMLLGYAVACVVRRPTRRDAGLASFATGIGTALRWSLAIAPVLGTALYLLWKLAPALAADALPAGGPTLGPTAVRLLVLAPLFEEPVFRGVVHPALRERLGPRAAIAGGAAIFALAHLPGIPVSQFLGGLVLHAAYERTRSLFAVVLLHALGNGALLAAGLLIAR